ncbi:MAG: metallophosphoesterase family protein [Verrucomicrobiota bacterium]
MKLGLISDTHGFLDPRLPRIFKGVDHILHAGDIGPDFLIAQLEAIAPVTAVLGNNDNSPCFPLTQIKALGDVKFLVHHIVTPRALSEELKARVAQERPEVVMFGHSHQKFDQVVNGVRFINPGYAGKPKFGAERSVALLEMTGKNLDVRFVKLPDTL